MRHRYSYDNYCIHLEQRPEGEVHRWVATIDKDHPWWALNNKPGEPGMTPTGYGATPGEAIEDLIGPKHGNNPRFLVIDFNEREDKAEREVNRARILHYHFHQGWGLVTVDQGVAYLERREPAEYDSFDGGRAALRIIKRELERAWIEKLES